MSISVGERIPEITLHDPSGAEVALSEQLAGPTMLLFMRHLV